ncbi:putative RNA polymerase II subunit B1 CTD phosphatase rpap2 [Lepisosteus oculatus]|uniref:putative RNA polymerase II subunit B1 CTD phosphatase rpap2 n=1 Tax=Lepisosteus oculatus TaxID=7918 RepID=UPI00371909C6
MEECRGAAGRSAGPGKKGRTAVKAQTALEAAKRKEALKEAVRRKLQLEQRALRLVEELLEDSVTEDFLLGCAKSITPGNYRDVVDERSIVKLCGYPVCQNKLVNVPKQQYKISTRTNKVYDITERKCFCSNFCYKASKYFEGQIPKTPLWSREEESFPDVTLMKQGESGSSGEEVRIAAEPVRLSEIETPQPEEERDPPGGESGSSDAEQEFVSSIVPAEGAGPRGGVAPPTGSGGGWGPKRVEGRGRMGQGTVEEASGGLRKCRIASEGDEGTSAGRCQRDRGAEEPGTGNKLRDDAPEPQAGITRVGVSKRAAEGLRSLLKDQKPGGGASRVVLKTSLLQTLRRTLQEWKTEETLRFLYGPDYEQRTPEAPAQAAQEEEEEEELDEDDLAELPEELGVGGCGPGSAGASRRKPSAPVPDFETLRRETEMLTLKVEEFYRGEFVLPEEIVPNPRMENEIHEHAGGEAPVLPLIDSSAQHLIQKKIVVEKLIRSLKDIVGPLRLTMNDIITDLNNLVRTFRFTNANIILRSPEWTLISLVLLSVLTQVSPVLRECMGSPSSVQYLSALTQELHLEEADLRSLVRVLRSPRD